ncbi:MAG: hypothetical protein C5B45_05355 [Chlamydiae bacterium]|nr:MAG: hypothetical protein C5B45_05355 [Chlamydiota bacterium]
MYHSNKFLSRLVQLWDPRPMLAGMWLEIAEKYEERLQASPSLDPQIVEAILQERKSNSHAF